MLIVRCLQRVTRKQIKTSIPAPKPEEGAVACEQISERGEDTLCLPLSAMFIAAAMDRETESAQKTTAATQRCSHVDGIYLTLVGSLVR